MGKRRSGKGGGSGKKANKGNKTPPKGGKQSKTVSSHNEEPGTPVSSKRSNNKSIPGLTNLGNTCFFNSVMQSLNQSHYLRLRLEHLVATPSFPQKLQLPNSEEVLTVDVVESLGDLTNNFWRFLQSMQERATGTLNPKPVFSEICKKAKRFSSHAQQDSQELLHYLLDALRLEEIHRLKRAILVSFNVGKNSKQTMTDKTRADVKAYGRQATLAQTFVDDVFGGTLVSTVTCDICGSCTTVQESFLDLSLPVSDDKAVSVPGKGSHQHRDNKKNKLLVDVSSPSSARTAGEKEDELLYPRKLSRHQKKKMEREKRKVEKRKPKHLVSAGPSSSQDAAEGMVTSDAQNASGDNGDEGDNEAKVSPTPARDSLLHEETAVESRDKPMTTSAASTSRNPATGEHTNSFQSNSADVSQENVDSSCNGVCVTASACNSGAGAANTTISSYEQSLDVSQQPQDNAQSNHASVVNVASSYASSGPQTDLPTAGSIGPENVEKTLDFNIISGGEDNGLNALAESVVKCGLDEELSGDNNDVGCNSDNQKEKEEPEISSYLLKVKLDPDSIEMSLREFCATERLVGDNQFACIQCTEKAAAGKKSKELEEDKMKTVRTEQEEGKKTMVRTEQEEDKKTMVRTEQEDEKTVVRTEQEEGGEEHAGEGLVNCPAASESGGSSEDHLDGADDRSDEDDEDESGEETGNYDGHLDSFQSQEDSRQSDELTSVESEGMDIDAIVFCDATKQLLIQTPPIVLTLHLKRFSQHGRQLRKNSKHVSFPLQLDLSSYCVDSCKERCDSSGRLLYSLFAVVVHSGSMYAGHYVAYIKQRAALDLAQVQQVCSWTRARTTPPTSRGTGPNQSTSSDLPVTPTNFAVPSEQLPLPSPAAADTSSAFTDNSSNDSTTPDNSPSASENSSPPPKCLTPPLDSSSPPDNSICHTSTPDDNLTPIENSNIAPTSSNVCTTTPNTNISTLSSVVKDSVAQVNNTKKQKLGKGSSRKLGNLSNCKEFDESAADGQWYYASDSHVKMVSEEEVRRSQAYLLFYELLPFRT